MSAHNIIEVRPFSEDDFFSVLVNDYCTLESVKQNRRARYLADYLPKIGVLTIVIENDYVDGDYVDDFASYYAKCFESYSIRCKRMHFFSLNPSEMSEASLSELSCNGGSDGEIERLQDAYRGFLVARPLPLAIIGRTVLRTYGSDGGRRHFPALLEYESNLLSIRFSLPSLAFQEQDKVIAACATVALWSALHKAADVFHTQAPRPSAITAAASQVVSASRLIPSRKGLIVEQMCCSVAQQGLEPEMISVVEHLPLRTLLYAYLEAKLAPIVIVQLEKEDGLHAVTLAGYSIQKDRVPISPPNPQTKVVPMIGARIDAFYGHDDQIGPFAKHEAEQSISDRPDTPHPLAFTGTWPVPGSQGDYQQMYPVQVIVPVYNKIRVSFPDVQLWVERMDFLFRQIIGPEAKYEWDVYLTTTTEYKKKIREKGFGSDAYRRAVILRQHPRFLWRALLHIRGSDDAPDGNTMFEVLFDATDIPNSFTAYCIAWHYEPFRIAVNNASNQPENEAEYREKLGGKLLACLRKASEKEVFIYPGDMKDTTD